MRNKLNEPNNYKNDMTECDGNSSISFRFCCFGYIRRTHTLGMVEKCARFAPERCSEYAEHTIGFDKRLDLGSKDGDRGQIRCVHIHTRRKTADTLPLFRRRCLLGAVKRVALETLRSITNAKLLCFTPWSCQFVHAPIQALERIYHFD